MQTVTFIPGPESFVYTFGGAEAALRVRPGTALQLWSEDCYSGQLSPGGPLPAVAMTSPDLNPQTGPFWVEGAQPGDTLAVHLVDLSPSRTWGISTHIAAFGGLTSTPEAPSLQDLLPERAYVYEYDAGSATVTYCAQDSGLVVPLPASPMLGTLGVAPARREVRSSLVPDYFGGNMDTPELRAGSTIFLRVNVEGALFSLGDGHYRQGEGESCGTAVEGAMNVTVIVDLIKGSGPAWPRLETDTHWMSIGSGRPLDHAWKAAQVDMIDWLGELYGLSRFDAYQLLSQVSQSPIANVVDTNVTTVTKVDKRLLPAATAYDDLHARLRAEAARLGSINY